MCQFPLAVRRCPGHAERNFQMNSSPEDIDPRQSPGIVFWPIPPPHIPLHKPGPEPWNWVEPLLSPRNGMINSLTSEYIRLFRNGHQIFVDITGQPYGSGWQE